MRLIIAARNNSLKIVSYFILIFLCSFVYNKLITTRYKSNSPVLFSESLVYSKILNFNTDTLPVKPLQVFISFKYDSIIHKGPLYLVLQGFDKENKAIYFSKNDILYSIKGNQFGKVSCQFQMFNDSINNEVELYKLYLYNKKNVGSVSKISVQIR